MSKSQRNHILIVDDTPLNLQIMTEILSSEYNIFTAQNGVAALQSVREKKPDLILLDIDMPEMNGYETCEYIKNDHELSDIPVIFVTSMNEEDDEEKGLALGAIDYIHKPIRPSILRARVRNHLELKKHRDVLQRDSYIDSLTELANRRRFNEYIDNQWQYAQKNETSVSLVLLDVDCFKKFNDSYGHSKGDECLKNIADELSGCAKNYKDMFVARYGGEEFAAILTNKTLHETIEIAEKIRKSIESLKIPHQTCEKEKFVTISGGVSSIVPNTSDKIKTLFNNADKALYKAKKNGRNKIETN
ncbi:MAG: diguanylate cyclase [Spirochaetia bacterium]|nr:diguanylate cyclase [Spirochaetia bacterium]